MSVPEHPVTIRDLMTHTSGVPDEPPAEIKDYRNAMNVTLDEVVRNVAKQKLLFQPGTAWSYSSAGMEVLGRIIEVVSGEKYEDFIAERILRPLKMKDSFFYPDKQTPDQQKRIAMVYVMQDGKLVPASRSILGGDPTKHRAGSVFPAPGWGLYSTAEDLLHLYEMMLHGGVYEGHRYLSEFAVHLMTEPHTSKIRPVGWSPGSDFGLGWEVVTEPLGELGGHSIGSFGHGGAFGTQGWIDPKNGLISIMLIQKADGRTETMSGAFLTMAEATVER
jgi:CubicO group peptidase (beta-lactamase class C family)